MAKVKQKKEYNIDDKISVNLIDIIPSFVGNKGTIRLSEINTIVDGYIINIINKNTSSEQLNIILDSVAASKIANIHSWLMSRGFKDLGERVAHDYHAFSNFGWRILIPSSCVINSKQVKKLPTKAIYKDNEYNIISREICNKRYYDLIDKEGKRFKTVPKKDKNLKFKQENVNTK